MSRYHVTEVSCDQCGCGMDHVPRGRGRSLDSYLRGSGIIVSKHGDFCDKNCLAAYKANGNQPCIEE